MIRKDPAKKTVYVLLEDCGNHDIFFDRSSRKDDYAVPYVYLREAIENLGYNFVPTFDYKGLGSYDDVAYIISITLLNQDILDSLSKHPKEKCFLFVNEPYTTYGLFYDKRLRHYFGKIFVMFEEFVDNQSYFSYLHAQCNEKFAENVPEFEDKKFCVMVQSNHFCPHPKSMYEERRKAARFFSSVGDFDLYGARWNDFSCWKGAFKTGKLDVIKNYKFCLSYENIHDQCGYITERIFDAFYASCIPIYLGPKNIYDYIPKNCFINLTEFSSYNDLYQFMNSIDKETYHSYLSAAKEFIASPEASVFSSRHLAKTVLQHLNPPV
ncbi:MAG TPA: hypothetical protein DCE71_08215 [Parachlamydiales bacterium]|nr:hypothetical protein [Parachlamydiales bacterium]